MSGQHEKHITKIDIYIFLSYHGEEEVKRMKETPKNIKTKRNTNKEYATFDDLTKHNALIDSLMTLALFIMTFVIANGEDCGFDNSFEAAVACGGLTFIEGVRAFLNIRDIIRYKRGDLVNPRERN